MLCKNNGRNRSPPTMKEIFQDILSVSLITRNILKHPEHFILLSCNIKYSTSHDTSHCCDESCCQYFYLQLQSALLKPWPTPLWWNLQHSNLFLTDKTEYCKIIWKKKKINLKSRVLKEFRNLEIHLYIIL